MSKKNNKEKIEEVTTSQPSPEKQFQARNISNVKVVITYTDKGEKLTRVIMPRETVSVTDTSDIRAKFSTYSKVLAII